MNDTELLDKLDRQAACKSGVVMVNKGDLVALISRVREAEAKWQPIEIAPLYDPEKDAMEVLLYSPEFGVKFGRAVRYKDGTTSARASGFSGDWNITHWMPAPKAPAANPTEAGR